MLASFLSFSRQIFWGFQIKECLRGHLACLFVIGGWLVVGWWLVGGWLAGGWV